MLQKSEYTSTTYAIYRTALLKSEDSTNILAVEWYLFVVQDGGKKTQEQRLMVVYPRNRKFHRSRVGWIWNFS